MKKNLTDIAKEDGRFDPRGLKFIYEGLGYTIKRVMEEPGHVSGKTLCEGLRKLALKKFGLLSKLVLNNWGIKSTRDIGEIVYLLIRHEWMSAQPTDTIEDFDDIYDFDHAFKKSYKFKL